MSKDFYYCLKKFNSSSEGMVCPWFLSSACIEQIACCCLMTRVTISYTEPHFVLTSFLKLCSGIPSYCCFSNKSRDFMQLRWKGGTWEWHVKLYSPWDLSLLLDPNCAQISLSLINLNTRKAEMTFAPLLVVAATRFWVSSSQLARISVIILAMLSSVWSANKATASRQFDHQYSGLLR